MAGTVSDRKAAIERVAKAFDDLAAALDVARDAVSQLVGQVAAEGAIARSIAALEKRLEERMLGELAFDVPLGAPSIVIE